MTARVLPAGEGGRVLVVDDSTAKRYLLIETLRRAGHEVTGAADATEALERLARADAGALPEVAVLDVMLPDMSGFELCQRIKEAEHTADMPVIHISATAVTVADRAQGLHGGADAYLTEPVDPAELLATITAVLRYTRARRAVQQLADRLMVLNEVTLALQRATTFAAFADVSVRGARAVLGAEAASVYLSLSGTPAHAHQVGSGAPAVSEDVPAVLLDRVSRAILGAPTGARVAGFTRRAWQEMLPGAPLSGDVLVAVVRARSGHAPVCVAVQIGRAPSEDDRTLLLQMAQACALSLESLRSYTEEHALALELQRSFLPLRLAAVEGVDLAVRYVPAGALAEIGGDFYEAVETPLGLLLAIGDVVGHSLEAAIAMGEVRHALRAYAIEGHRPDVILGLLDTVLAHDRSGLTTLSLCLVLVEPGCGRLHIANAGHIPPLLVTAEGSRFVREHGRILGLGGGRFVSTVVEVTGPTRVVLCTDGLVEVRGTDLGESLDDFAVAAHGAAGQLDDLCTLLLQAFGRDKDDDIALLAADLRPAVGSLPRASPDRTGLGTSAAE